MFYSKSLNNDRKSGVVGGFPESLVNPLYKPKTLSELKALCVHTGVNPSPVELRPGLPEVGGKDAMETPPIPVFADTFEAIRAAKKMDSEIKDIDKQLKEEVEMYKKEVAKQKEAAKQKESSKQSEPAPVVSPKE